MPRTATITATSNCQVLRIDGPTFVSTVLETPMVAVGIGEAALARLNVTHPALASRRPFDSD